MAPDSMAAGIDLVETDIPARLDRLPFSRFHRLVIAALGITWILDGLEVTLAGAVAGALGNPASLGLGPAEIGLAASVYLAGAVLGALCFGYLTDRLGRKRLFSVTLGLYLVATAATACSVDLWTFALCRFLTGAGIGGEYTAINSAIQEFTPARLRGRVDLIINGSFWLGAALGAGASVVLLDPGLLPVDVGWRVVFGIGATLGAGILWLRRWLPESPRWLMTHGRLAEAERVVAGIEAEVAADRGPLAPVTTRILIRHDARHGLLAQILALIGEHRRRALLGLTLMTAQAFFYNAIFFTYALVLARFYGVPADRIGLFLLPFAAGNFLGPLLLGPLFDSLGRKPMIAGTYAGSGLLLAITAWLFQQGLLDATSQTIAWSVIFFVASAAASSAYLTVSESFPLEARALAIALFYAFGTALGGIIGPTLFGRLIETGDKDMLALGYLGAALLMLVAAGVELAIGVKAERLGLEEIARPLGQQGQSVSRTSG